ncbi:uncharacterized protein V3H82_019088 isoform 2-T2 [Fundulus diaphanus]
MDPDHKLRGLTRRPQMTRRGTDRTRHVRKEENFTDHQDGNLKVDREKPEPVQIKEEWDELTTPQMTDNNKKQELLSITEHQAAQPHQLIKEEQVELHILQDQEQLEHLKVTAEKVEQEPKNQAEQQHQQTKEEPEELEILQVKVEETEICIGEDEEEALRKQETNSYEERDHGEPEPIRNQRISQDSPEAEIQNHQGSSPEDSEATRDENLYSCEARMVGGGGWGG